MPSGDPFVTQTHSLSRFISLPSRPIGVAAQALVSNSGPLPCKLPVIPQVLQALRLCSPSFCDAFLEQSPGWVVVKLGVLDRWVGGACLVGAAVLVTLTCPVALLVGPSAARMIVLIPLSPPLCAAAARRLASFQCA
jgi:hypothetical protein